MASVRFSVRGLDQAARNLQRFGRTAKAQLDRDAFAAMLDGQAEAKRKVPVGVSGALRSGITTPQRIPGGYRVTATARHAINVERGRRPGRRPPTSALTLWVQRKLGVPAAQARGVAYVVARRIGRMGTKAQPFMGPGAEAARRTLARRIAATTKRLTSR